MWPFHSTESANRLASQRLSTIRNADRIAVIEGGRVREIGTHDELLANEFGRYRRLQMLQDIDTSDVMMDQLHAAGVSHALSREQDSRIKSVSSKRESIDVELDKERARKNAKRAWAMGAEDYGYFVIGTIGACIAGLVFPSWGKTHSVHIPMPSLILHLTHCALRIV